MSKRARTLIMSFVVMVLSIAVLAGGTYALFQSTATIKGHLSAGSMDMQLMRNSIGVGIVDANGNVTISDSSYNENASDEVLDLTDANGGDLYKSMIETIVPGQAYGAKLTLKNKDTSDVSFTYTAKISLDGDKTQSSALVENVTIYLLKGDGTKIASGKLNGSNTVTLGGTTSTLAPNASLDFTVVVAYDYNATAGANGDMYFNLLVKATQVAPTV